jgi:hypothetical protein
VRKLTFFLVGAAGVVAIGSVSAAPVRGGLPQLQVGPSCDAAARGSVILGRNKEACLADETTAQDTLKRGALPLLIQPCVTSSAMKQQQHGAGPGTSNFRDSRYDGAIRATLGKTFRERHDLMEPLAPRLLELLAQLDISVHVRETTEAELYAEVDECVAAMVRAANRQPREPEA